MLIKKALVASAVLLLSTSGAMAQTGPGAKAVLKACKPDIARFCSQVSPGQGRIKACMKEHPRAFRALQGGALPGLVAAVTSRRFPAGSELPLRRDFKAVRQSAAALPE